MGRLVGKLYPDKDAVMQWHTQAVNITTNLMVKVDFTSPTLIMRYAVMWNFHVDYSAKSIYDMVLGRCLLKELV